MIILSFYCGHDAGAAVWKDGLLAAAVSKERLTRRKGDFGETDAAIAYVLEAADVGIDQVDMVATSRGTHLAFTKSGRLIPETEYGPEQVHSEHRIELFGRTMPCLSVPHHIAHAAHAFFTSPFNEAAILSLDGGGDFTAALTAVGSGHQLDRIRTLPLNICLLWNAVATTLGLEWFHGPGKIMGLASYGQPRFREELLDYCGGLFEEARIPDPREVWRDKFEALHSPSFLDDQVYLDRDGVGYGIPEFKGRVSQRNFDGDAGRDLCASLQGLTEDVVLHCARNLNIETGTDNLCLTGGIALNPGVNRIVHDRSNFRHMHIPAGPNDAGLPIGLALYAAHQVGNHPRPLNVDPLFTGKRYGSDLVAAAITASNLKADWLGDDIAPVAEFLAQGRAIGWFLGGAEIGPRALGHRSILADPRKAGMREWLNSEVKRREWFRPYAPVILQERVSEWFDIAFRSAKMEYFGKVRPDRKAAIPAVVHVDDSARIQTLEEGVVPELTALLRRFDLLTGVPLLLNTSLNPPGRPLVETPAEALAIFSETPLAALWIDGWWIRKEG